MSKAFHRSFFAMNTRCNMVFPNIHEEKAIQISIALKKETQRIEFLLSRFISNSEISKVNRFAFDHPVKVSDEVFSIIKVCKKYHQLTQNGFDITLYPLIKYWNEHETYSNQNSEYDLLSKNIGTQHIILNEEEKSVSFSNKYIDIDLGGIGKGYALKRMNDYLLKYSISDAFISFGESSVLSLGKHPAGDCWKVGNNNLLNPGEPLHSFEMRDESISTSSNFVVDDRGNIQNHWHVIDPKTLKPVDEFTSVSVKSNSPVLAEILSTAMLVSSNDSISEIANHFDEAHITKFNYIDGKPTVIEF